jgi:hypothetical protein
MCLPACLLVPTNMLSFLFVHPFCLAHPAASQRLALLCLGEIGRRTDLSSAPNVESAVNSSLNSENEDIRAAASLALGGVACGNLGRFLPALLQSIEGAGGQSKQQYLLLQVRLRCDIFGCDLVFTHVDCREILAAVGRL